MSDLADLIAKLGSASGPSRALDGDILAHVDAASCAAALGLYGVMFPPAYTRSIDAALSLVPEGWRLETLSKRHVYKDPVWFACVRREIELGIYITDGADYDDAYALSPALALCIAALKARSAA